MPRKKKYVKTIIEIWKCEKCDFSWCYKTFKCPICSSMKMTKVV